MRKISKRRGRIFGLLAILLPLSLVALSCGSDSDDESSDIKVGLVFDIGGRGDQSFNDSAAAGLERAEADFGLADTTEFSPNADGSNREELLNLAAEDNDVVFGVGFLFADPIKAASAASPDTCFGIVDDPAADAPSNVAGLVFAEHEGSYLVGVAAALKTQRNNVGFIGGVSIPLIQKFEAGFTAGVKAVNPDIQVQSQYVSNPPNFDGFNDPATAKVIGQSMYQNGADIVYHAAGGSGGGLFEAAKEFSDGGSKVWAIGVDSDQYLTVDADLQEYVLTSMIKSVDVAVYSLIENNVDGTCPSGVVTYDLSVDGVGYATSGGFIDDIVDELESYKSRIISGAISVPETP